MSDISGIGGGAASYYAQAIQQLEQRLFGQIDASGSGSITKSELEQAVNKAGGTTASADALYQQLDPNNTGSVSEQQFAQNLPLPIFSPEAGAQLISAQAQASGTGTDPVTQINENLFQQLTNGSGNLTKSELEQAVTAAGGTTASADALYAQLDPNNTGSVSEQQFLQNLPAPHHHHHGDASASNATGGDSSGNGSSTGTDSGNSAQDALMALIDSLLQSTGTTASNTGDSGSQTGSGSTSTTTAAATSTTTSSNSAEAALFDLINNLDSSSQTAAAGTSTTDTGNSADDALMALLNASNTTASNSNASAATSADAASNQNSTPASLFGMFNQQILAMMLQLQSQSIAA